MCACAVSGRGARTRPCVPDARFPGGRGRFSGAETGAPHTRTCRFGHAAHGGWLGQMTGGFLGDGRSWTGCGRIEGVSGNGEGEKWRIYGDCEVGEGGGKSIREIWCKAHFLPQFVTDGRPG